MSKRQKKSPKLSLSSVSSFSPPSQRKTTHRDPAHPADAHVHRHRAELLGAVELFQGAEAVLFFFGVVFFSVLFFFFFFFEVEVESFFFLCRGRDNHLSSLLFPVFSRADSTFDHLPILLCSSSRYFSTRSSKQKSNQKTSSLRNLGAKIEFL